MQSHGIWAVSGLRLARFTIGPASLGDLAPLTVALDRRLADVGGERASIVRTRIVGGSPAARVAGSEWRASILTGVARAASSSYVDGVRSSDPNGVLVDVIVCTDTGGAVKRAVEHDPPKRPTRWVELDPLVFISGTTSEAATLADQVGAIAGALAVVVGPTQPGVEPLREVRCYLHRSLETRSLLDLIPGWIVRAPCGIRVWPVDGFSSPKKLVEFELTVSRPTTARHAV